MNKKILIVEDEYILANALRLNLEHAGYVVIGIASSVAEADEIMHKQKPDLVLLDIQLEGKKTGIDLAKKLNTQNIAFIYLSANSSQKILEDVKKTEPYGFLVKPYREKDLLVALDIAFYRLQNSVESKSRRDEILLLQLSDISNQNSGTENKLLQIGRILQPHIPFDLIILQDAKQNNAYGYLRIGFDEYQFIGEKESMTVTGLKTNAFLETNQDHSATDAAIFDIATIEKSHLSAFQKILLGHFKIASYLAFPVARVRYLFCSRKSDWYTQDHMVLLDDLKIGLTNIVAGKTPTETATLPPNNEIIYPEYKTIVGKHPSLLAALDLTTQVAPYNTSVLILGESGTGKEKVAECIHTFSTRKDKPLVKINCAAIPASLIEAELFGHEKGAFTGAMEKRKGKFEQADGGTIFLDEIGELSLDMQVRLLRVLQEKEIDPLGGSSPRKVDVRIVAATNRNLEKEVAEGKFRLDLYYRLNVFPITLPPLRERKSDIAALAFYFADKFCKEFNKHFTGIGTAMAQALDAYDWPGNIRELENVLERSVILSDGKSELELKQKLSDMSVELSDRPTIETLADVRNIQRETERGYIVSILKKTNGRIRGIDGAAALLDIKPTTLESKMAKLGIKKDDFTH